MFRINNFVILQPELLYLLIPIGVLIIYILRKKFVKDDIRLFKSRGKFFIFMSKIIFFTLILIALSTPYLEYEDTKGNLTKIKVLIDRSTSMDLYNIEDSMLPLYESGIPLDITELDLDKYSSLGQSILNNLAPDENLLLITDGQNNFGTDLEDVALFASTINSKLYSVKLEEKEEDASIIIQGPSKVVSEVENTFTISLNEIGNVRKRVKIYVDDKLELEQQYESPIAIKKSFKTGSHVIKAVLENEDLFQENNVFYKVINVHKKPKLLFVSKTNSPLYELYYDFYDVDLRDDIKDLDKYHAVILNNIHADDLDDDDIDELEEYLNDENGLFVIGGKDSYDWGDYNKSLISNILPVSIGQAKKKKDVINLFIVMDTGASGGEEISGDITFFDVQKSVAVDIINSISNFNKVGFIEGNYYLNTLTGLSELGPKKEQIITDLSLMTPHGFSEIRYAYEKAHQSLRLAKGSRNIIIITDGKLIPQDQAMTLEIVKKARSDGIKTYIVGIGDSADDEFLKSIKEFGGGEYFKMDETQKLKLYFGDPSEQSSDRLEIYVYDSNHFITKDLDDLSKIYGFNSVYPKSNARLLLTTSTGDPVLTIWNYGLGRVASLTTDDGSLWMPDMLKDINSEVLIRTINWLVENPERKNNLVVEIPELRVNENAIITVKSETLPGSNYFEEKKGIFKTNIYPNETGVISILESYAGVNYIKEYLNLGINPDLEHILQISGGSYITENFGEQLQSLTKVETIKTKDLSWLFVLGGITVYLIEILIRRIINIRIERKY